MEQFQEINIPQIEEKRRKNKKIAVVVIISCIAIFAAFAVAGVLIVRAYNSDERKLARGLKNLMKEAIEQQKLWDAAAGGTSADRFGSTKTEMTLNLSGEELPVTIGIDMSLLKDNDAHKMKSDTVLSVMNNELLEGIMYGDDKRIMLSFPDLWRQNLEFSPYQINRQYNESLLAEKLGGIEIEEEISIELFPEAENVSLSDSLENWMGKEISIEKLDEPANISFPGKEDRQYKCSQYRIVIPKEWIEDMEQDGGVTVDTGMEVTADIAEDVAILIDMEKNSRIVRISLEKPVQFWVESEEYAGIAELTGSIGFLGEKRSIDDIYANMEIEYVLDFLDSEGEELPEFWDYYLGESRFKLQLETQIGYNESDTRVTTKINKLELSSDSIGAVKLTGEIDVEPLREKILPLNGETIQIFRMTEEEYEDLENQLQNVIQKWMAVLLFMD